MNGDLCQFAVLSLRIPDAMRFIVLCLMLCLLVGAVYGQEAGALEPAGARPIDLEAAPRPAAQATRTSSQIVLDGVLDEPDWQAADSVTGFIQAQP